MRQRTKHLHFSWFTLEVHSVTIWAPFRLCICHVALMMCVLTENGEALVSAVPTLATILAAPSHSQSKTKEPARDVSGITPAPDPLAMQLDALHVLLLLLPVPHPQVPCLPLLRYSLTCITVTGSNAESHHQHHMQSSCNHAQAARLMPSPSIAVA